MEKKELDDLVKSIEAQINIKKYCWDKIGKKELTKEEKRLRNRRKRGK